MKKVYLLFLLALLPFVVYADPVEINGIWYNLVKKAKTAEVTRDPNSNYYSGSYYGDLVIPKTITYEGIKYSVTSIGGGAFHSCHGLTSIVIPASVTSIGYEAFWHCNDITSITIEGSIPEIGCDAFGYCEIENLIIMDLTAWCNSTESNRFPYKHLYFKDEEIKNLIIPDGVTHIPESAFADCSSLISVTIPKSVTDIGEGVFRNCNGLKSIKVEKGNSFYDSREGCNAIIKTNDNELIQGCNNTVIPNSVTSINDGAFYGCSSLTSIIIPNSVTSIGGYAFYNCSGLASVTIPNSVTSIGCDAFEGCCGLPSITIPNSVTSIGSDAFYGCSGLTSITIGNGIELIEYGAFAECPELTDVYCYAENVPTANGIFDGSYVEYATLHVPVGSVDAYKATEPWSNFKSIAKISSKVSLNKTETTLEKGKTVTLKATVTPTKLLDKSVTWKSSNTKIATVSSSGKVKGIKGGTATITCTSKVSGAKATCKVTIVDGSVSLDKTKVTLEKGSTVTLKPTVLTTSEDKSVTWTTSSKSIATVSSKGKVKGIKAGTATITCTSVATGLSATCKVTVINGTVTLNKTEAFIEKGKTTTLKATLTPTTLEDMSVKWTSSDKTVATVSSSGKVKGVGYGTATITCTSVATGVSATCQVTIGKVVINMSDFSLKKTRTVTLVATVYPTTLTDKSVTWKSSDTKVATVSSSGKVKGVGAGTATITCTSNATGLKGTCTVTVLAASESRSIEGDDDEATGIDEVNIESTEAQPYDVYDLSGRKVAHQVTTLEGLPNGIYIVNGKKILKK